MLLVMDMWSILVFLTKMTMFCLAWSLSCWCSQFRCCSLCSCCFGHSRNNAVFRCVGLQLLLVLSREKFVPFHQPFKILEAQRGRYKDPFRGAATKTFNVCFGDGPEFSILLCTSACRSTMCASFIRTQTSTGHVDPGTSKPPRTSPML